MAPLLRFCTAFLGVIASSSAELDADEPGVSMLQADSRGVRRSASNPLLVAALTDGMLDYLADSDAPYTAEEVGHIAANMAANFFPNGTLVAAPSKVSSNHSNDYFFMWQRDAALTMRTLLRITVAAPGGKFAAIIGDVGSPIRQQLVRYAELLPKLWNQADPNTMCPPWYKDDQPGWCPPLGEPKYFVNGSVYDQPWGRPQNDGPALAAVYLSDLLNAILDDGGNSTGDFTAELLRGGGTEGILYDALDFVNTWYNEGSVGPWEEIYGNHFFVAEVQRKALLEGARVAKRMGQDGDAQWPKSGYKNWVYSAGNLRGASESFFSEDTLVVKATVGRQQGLAGPKCLSSERVLLETGEVWPTMVEFPCELDVNTVIAANFVFNSKAADARRRNMC
ncbi:unnamed protein product [Effrenium voratum]|nr:unnamed protein product [Effrenium voratum]